MKDKLAQLKNLIIRPQEHSLKLKSMRAALWSFLEKGCSHALRIIGSLILTRILFPEAFGIMATSHIVIVMIQLFTDVGVKTAIVQNPKGAHREFLDTAWVICAARGVLLALAVVLLAWPLSSYYNQPEIKGILMILALSPLFLGFENPAVMVLIKNFRVEKKVILELTSQPLGLVTTIILAYLMQSVYALAIGASLSSLYRVAGSYLVDPYRPRLRIDKTFGLEIFHFGKFIFINTMVSFTAMNIDILMIGKILPMKDLGLYSLGKNIGQLIWIVCLQVFVQSYMPAVSSVYHDIPRIVRMYQRSVTLILALTIPLSMIFALFAHDIIGILYDPRYQDASISMLWFSLSGIFLVFIAINTNTFIAMGKPVYETMAMATGALFIVVLIPAGTGLFGLHGAAGGMFVSIVIIASVQTINLKRAFGFPLSTLIHPWIQILSVGAAVFSIHYLLCPLLSSRVFLNIPFMIIMSMIALLVSVALYLLREGGNPFRDYMPANKEG